MRKRSSADMQKIMSSAPSLKKLRCLTENCGNIVNVDIDTKSVLCYKCTIAKAPMEKKVEIEKSNRPAGWRFMKEFVDADGTVYHIGIEQPELKGTKKLTDVNSIKAAQKEKRKSNKLKKHEKEEKREKKLLDEFKRKKEEKKKVESEIKNSELINKFVETE